MIYVCIYLPWAAMDKFHRIIGMFSSMWCTRGLDSKSICFGVQCWVPLEEYYWFFNIIWGNHTRFEKHMLCTSTTTNVETSWCARASLSTSSLFFTFFFTILYYYLVFFVLLCKLGIMLASPQSRNNSMVMTVSLCRPFPRRCYSICLAKASTPHTILF